MGKRTASKKLTLILGAMPQEVKAIREHLEKAKEGRLSVFPYLKGKLHDRDAIVAITGVGKSNAAMVASIFIFHFKPSEVVFTGTGSRLNRKLRTGDVIIGEQTAHHDMGTMNSRGMQYRSFRGPLKGTITPYRYRADKRLLKLAREAARTYKPKQITANGETYYPIVKTGLLCGGDVFGQSEARIKAIRRELKAELMEMESPVISLVCRQLKVPHLVFRGGSNLTQENPSGDYQRLGPVAAHSAASFTMHFIAHLEKAEKNQAPSA